MYSTYNRSRTYNMSDDSRVIYGQAISVRIIEIRMYYGTNNKRYACNTVQTIETRMYYSTNKKPVEIPYARYEVLKYMITHNSPQPRKVIHVESL
jgi:hypothetical protein